MVRDDAAWADGQPCGVVTDHALREEAFDRPLCKAEAFDGGGERSAGEL